MKSCNNCAGDCCSAILPCSFEERKTVREYLDKNNILGYNYNKDQNIFNIQFHNICPFLNPNSHKCMIYPVRFEVCQAYDCNKGLGKTEINHKGKSIVNFYTEFFPEWNILYKPDVKELNEEYQEKKRKAGIE